MKNQSRPELKVCFLLYTYPNYLSNLPTFFSEWVNTYEDQFVEIKSLQTAVDEFMRHYDKTKAKEEKKLKANEGVPDDEGWITVTRE